MNVCKNSLDIHTSKMNIIFNTYICFDSSQHLALDSNNFVQINFLDILLPILGSRTNVIFLHLCLSA